MKKIFFLFLLFLSYGYGEVFTDPFSGITFEIPKGFTFSESESKTNRESKVWWYVFVDAQKNLISVEIEEYDQNKTITDLYETAVEEEDEDLEELVYGGLEFKDIGVEEMEMTKCKLRILAISDKHSESLYLCDYLFVAGNFGFSINLIKKEGGIFSNEESEAMMLDLLKSVHFQLSVL